MALYWRTSGLAYQVPLHFLAFTMCSLENWVLEALTLQLPPQRVIEDVVTNTDTARVTTLASVEEGL